jgi:hypothetical protein
MEEATRRQREGVIKCLGKWMFSMCQKLPSLKFRDWKVKWRRLSFFNSRAGLSQLPSLTVQFNIELEDRKVFKDFHIWKKTNLRLLSKHALLYMNRFHRFLLSSWAQVVEEKSPSSVWKEIGISPSYNYIIIVITTLYPFFEDPFERKMYFVYVPIEATVSRCSKICPFRPSWKILYLHIPTTHECTIQETVFYWKLPTIPTHKSLEHLGTQKPRYVFVQTAANLNHVSARQIFLLICPACSYNRTSMCSIGLSKLLHHSTQVWQSQFKSCFFSI